MYCVKTLSHSYVYIYVVLLILKEVKIYYENQLNNEVKESSEDDVGSDCKRQ